MGSEERVQMNAFRQVIAAIMAASFLAGSTLSANSLTMRNTSIATVGEPGIADSLVQEVRHRKYRKYRNYHHHRGYRRHRHYHHDHYNPWPAIIGGVIIGGIIANAAQWQAHQNWCYQRYRSYDGRSNTFQPYHGPRRYCRSPYGQ